MSSDQNIRSNEILDLDLSDFLSDAALNPISSAPARKEVAPPVDVAPDDLAVDSEEYSDPLFRLLAEPELPALKKRDRARLQLQSPNRIHFYWSVRSNPFKTLEKALGGGIGSYALVARLRNLTNGTEQVFQVHAKGDSWFDVDSDSMYRAEIGFYAPNRPYVRIAFSNRLHTPRKQPSQRTDYTPSFAASAGEFAKALDAAGYKKDAFDVALAGDDRDAAWSATNDAFLDLTGKRLDRQSESFENDLRFALMALAAGYSVEEIGKHIDPAVFNLIKKELSGISAEDALGALEDRFDVVTDEFEESEEFGSTVFGASLVNFPRRLRRKRIPRSLVPKLEDLERQGSITSSGAR